VQDRAIITIRH